MVKGIRLCKYSIVLASPRTVHLLAHLLTFYEDDILPFYLFFFTCKGGTGTGSRGGATSAEQG